MDAQHETGTAAGTAAADNTNRQLTAIEAALFLCFSKGYLYKLVTANKIAYYRPGGKILYFSREDLEKYAYRHCIASKYELREQAENILNGCGVAPRIGIQKASGTSL
jgi:excisionase family DNA binding protein